MMGSMSSSQVLRRSPKRPEHLVSRPREPNIMLVVTTRVRVDNAKYKVRFAELGELSWHRAAREVREVT